MIKVAFFGDSICLGQGISIHNGWVPRLSKSIEKKLENKSSLIFNSSYNGRTTRQALLQMPFEMLDHKPDILLIQFGMNDCNYWETDNGLPRVSLNSFKENITEMINRGFNCGTKYIILNTNHPTPKKSNFKNLDFSYEHSNKIYNETLRSISTENKNLIINDINSKILDYLKFNKIGPRKIVLEDGIHLNSVGHDLYYDFTSKIINKLIFQL